MRQTICLVLCVLGFIPFTMVLCWFFNLPVPEPATIDLSQLPANTMLVPVNSTGRDPIAIPPGVNVDELVQYAEHDSYLSLAFFKRDSANPSMLTLKETNSYDASNLWHKPGQVAVSRFSLENRTFTAYPQKHYADVWAVSAVFAFAEFFCMLIGSFFVRRRKDGTVPEPCSV